MRKQREVKRYNFFLKKSCKILDWLEQGNLKQGGLMKNRAATGRAKMQKTEDLTLIIMKS